MSYEHLSSLLWEQRKLIEFMLFKAEFKQFIILNGKTKWLSRTSRELEIILEEIRAVEVQRAALVEALAAELGLTENPSLQAIAEAAPAPWDDLFREHHEGLLLLVNDLRAISEANRDLVGHGLQAINDAMSQERPASGVYTAKGHRKASTHQTGILESKL